MRHFTNFEFNPDNGISPSDYEDDEINDDDEYESLYATLEDRLEKALEDEEGDVRDHEG